MGMHIGLVAAKTSVARLRDAFLRAWPNYQLAESADHLGNPQEAQAWQKAHARRVTAAQWSADNLEKMAFIFWQDGPWAAFMDESYVLGMDEPALAQLSAELGTVITFTVETAGGCAFFRCFENGQLRRSIDNSDGEMSSQGDPLPQEAGIDTGKYYMQETEQLASAFGLVPFDQMPTSADLQAISVIDRTDYGEVSTTAALPPPKEPAQAAMPRSQQKPWWKFW
jgi:hypothetical protein